MVGGRGIETGNDLEDREQIHIQRITQGKTSYEGKGRASRIPSRRRKDGRTRV